MNRLAIDSSGRLVGIFDLVSNGASARPEGTSVLSSKVEGRRREVGSSVDGRASNGTSDRGIISRLFSEGETQANPPPDGCLLVGRARRAPGCMPLRAWPTPERRAQRCRWFWALSAYALRTKRLPVPHATVRPPGTAASQMQIPARAQAA